MIKTNQNVFFFFFIERFFNLETAIMREKKQNDFIFKSYNFNETVCW